MVSNIFYSDSLQLTIMKNMNDQENLSFESRESGDSYLTKRQEGIIDMESHFKCLSKSIISLFKWLTKGGPEVLPRGNQVHFKL